MPLSPRFRSLLAHAIPTAGIAPGLLARLAYNAAAPGHFCEGWDRFSESHGYLVLASDLYLPELLTGVLVTFAFAVVAFRARGPRTIGGHVLAFLGIFVAYLATTLLAIALHVAVVRAFPLCHPRVPNFSGCGGAYL
jgi:hypothetical protein